jgi:hypothetical protein
MKSYESMTPVELVCLIREQDRIIDSLVRELKTSKADLRKRNQDARSRAVSKGRMQKLTPERRKEISQIAQAGKQRKRQEELALV